MKERTSRISKFFSLPPDERIQLVSEFADLSVEDIEILKNTGSLTLEQANRMVENVIGSIQIPLGVAVNFLINGQDYLIPMAIEEPSVIAAASNAAKIARESGGFFTQSSESIMIGQIQVSKLIDPYGAKFRVIMEKEKLIEEANSQDPILIRHGGGVKKVTARVVPGISKPILLVELHIDCKDAMGANVVNTMAESVAPIIEDVTGGKVLLRIVSNLCVERLARASVTVKKDILGGEDLVDGIVEAYELAASDIYRCATHNKGVMNGIIAVALATGNDTRALEAGAHAYAALYGGYKPLTIWEKTKEGHLTGVIELPIAVGVIGGATVTHPIAKISRKILGIKSSREFAEVLSAVGLGQNLAALRVLVAEGIQKGHMKLHARNIAAMAGAEGQIIDQIAKKMIQENNIRIDRAEELIRSYRSKD